MNKVLPNNIDAEKLCLNAILMSRDSLLDLIEILKPEYFYYNSNKEIFNSILILFQEGSPIDIMSIKTNLSKRKLLTKVGGEEYLAELVENSIGSLSGVYYGNIVKELYIRRELISAGGDIVDLSFDENVKISDVINESEKKLFGVSSSNIKSDFVHLKELLSESYKRAEEIEKSKDKLRGILSGFIDLDNILGGFQESNLVIVAARPSVGKTSFLLDIARNASLKAGKNVAMFSLEMSNSEITDRLISSQVGMNLWDYRMGHFDSSKLENLADVMGRLSEANLYIDDTPGQNIMEMSTKARRLDLENKIDLIIVDYLQLISGSNKENRVQEVSEISRFLKNIARELKVPVIAASQLSRAVETRTSKIPQLSDLRESGAIEQDADVVVFLHREEIYDPDNEEKKGIADVIVSKHRNGPIGSTEIRFIKEQAKFGNLAKH
jgi:replicative DNA helicase